MHHQEFLGIPAREIASDLELIGAAEIVSYLQRASKSSAQQVFFALSNHAIIDVFPLMSDDLVKKIFIKSDTHKAARIFAKFSKSEVEKKLHLLPSIATREIKDFLHYHENTAGYLMETSLLSCYEDETVSDIITKLRKIGDKRIITTYVVDDEHKLIGRVPVNYLAIAHPDQKISELMGSAPSVNALATRDEVLNLIEAHTLLQIPVVDTHDHLLGIIRNDILVKASREEGSADMQSLFGASKEEHALSKASFAIRKRLPWLQINLATAFLASLVVGLFEDTIAKMTILAIFLPVVAGQSGNTGSQALAVTIRGLALKEIRIGQWLRVAKKELLVGFVNGVAVALTTGIIVFFWADSLGIAIVIGISMILSMVIAGFAGAIIPIGLKAMGQDPATSSSIVLTTVTDICGFLSFLGLASALSSVLGIG